MGVGVRRERSDPDLLARVLDAKIKLAAGEEFEVHPEGCECDRCVAAREEVSNEQS